MAVDIEEGALRQLRANFDKSGLSAVGLHTIRADLRSFPLDQKFEGLLAANALHFLNPIEQASAVETYRKVLRPGGRLIVVEYNTARQTGAVPHPLPAEAFIAMAQQAGFGEVVTAARVPSSYLGEMYAGVASAV